MPHCLSKQAFIAPLAELLFWFAVRWLIINLALFLPGTIFFRLLFDLLIHTYVAYFSNNLDPGQTVLFYDIVLSGVHLNEASDIINFDIPVFVTQPKIG